MSFKIDRVRVDNFRGIRHIDLAVGGKNLIIYGENGSGKSSVVDAIEYLFTRTVGKLTGRADVTAKESIPHLKGGQTQVEVVFQNAGECVSVPYPAGKVRIPVALRPFFDLAVDRPFILRRSQILAFINAKPSGRYSEISKIVGLGELDAVDDRWRRERTRLQHEAKRVSGQLDEEYQKLSELLENTVRSQNELLRAVNGWLRSYELAPIGAREQIVERCAFLENELRSDPDLAVVAKLQSLLAETESIGASLQAAFSAQQSLAENIQAFWQHSAVLEDASLERLLNEGHRHLSNAPDRSSCPLCEAPIPEMSALMRRLQLRIDELQNVTRLRKEVQRARGQLAGVLSNVWQRLGMLLVSLQEIDLPLELTPLTSGMEELARWKADLQAEKFGNLPAGDMATNEALAALAPGLEAIACEIEKEHDALAFSNRDLELSRLKDRLIRIDENWRDLQHSLGEANRLDFLYQQTSIVYQELIAARQRGIERLRRELESDFERFYQFLHPDEGYEKISIAPQTEKRSSVDLTARFHGHKPAHPLNFYSEGHLDSLGLCIFLAFIKHFNGELQLIALDDVLTTVDAGHRLRVARLLAREFGDYQLIITTHDQLWARQLERVLPNTELITLKRWSLEHGADYVHNVVSAWNHYHKLAREGYPQDAIAGTARNLEKFLFQMRGNLALSVPAKRHGDYTIGDLYQPFFKWVNDHPIARPDKPDFAGELATVQRALGELWRLRNWAGAHFNEWAETVTTDEAVEFVDTVRDLVTLFECPLCANLVVYNRSAQALICPVCKPQPPVHTHWSYDPGWHGRAIRMLSRNHAQLRKNALAMTTSQFTYFLRDMRRHVGLSVPARQDDAYTAAELYPPFLEWAQAHPHAVTGSQEWGETLKERHLAVLTFRHDGRWNVRVEQLDAFVRAIHQFISLFSCDACAQLLDHDGEDGGYFCAACDGRRHSSSRASAYWFVGLGLRPGGP